MPTNSWSPDSQYLSTVLNEPNAVSSHAAAQTPAQAQIHASTPPRPRQSSTHLQPQQAAQQTAFTPAQRSAQARGKPFSAASASTTIATAPTSNTLRPQSTEAESYALRQRRAEAAAILDSQEMLL
ncbi:hypothetical protein N0V95_006791, partial [Ascochyta clinopodiicola]